jgi:hypothetical protein
MARLSEADREPQDQTPRRRRLQIALGLIWLFVGALQFQPFMFGKSFVTTLEGTTVGQAQWIKSSVNWVFGNIVIHHFTFYNALFATIQVVIGLLILYRPTVRLGLTVSIPWSIAVWWFGEAFGGLWGGAMPVMGYPGAVMIYAMVALLVWPRDSEPEIRSEADSVSTGGLLGATGARLLWAFFWLACARFTLLAENRSPGALAAAVAGMGDGEPQWIKDIDTTIARDLLNHRGTEWSILLAVLFSFTGIAIFFPRLVRAAVITAVALGACIWIVEDFGAIFTSQGTDPNSGLLIVLFALCYWPLRPFAASKGRSQAPAEIAAPA